MCKTLHALCWTHISILAARWKTFCRCWSPGRTLFFVVFPMGKMVSWWCFFHEISMGFDDENHGVHRWFNELWWFNHGNTMINTMISWWYNGEFIGFISWDFFGTEQCALGGSAAPPAPYGGFWQIYLCYSNSQPTQARLQTTTSSVKAY